MIKRNRSGNIPDSDLLLKKAAELMNKNNKICISEQKCNDVEYFRKLAKDYGFKLNEYIPANMITARSAKRPIPENE